LIVKSNSTLIDVILNRQFISLPTYIKSEFGVDKKDVYENNLAVAMSAFVKTE